MKNFINLEATIPGPRREYFFGKLDEKDVALNPFVQFQKWFAQALKKKIPSPHAVTLGTATKKGKPSARIVLLKGFDQRGFIFFTHYQSRKGRELARNPRGALVVYWPEMERQIRIEGKIRKSSREESQEYFQSRPRDSQLAAWISHQSQRIESRRVLEEKFLRLQRKYRGKVIPLPSFWGGYWLSPQVFEFWQGRENRLNDRLRYVKKGVAWHLERLQP